MLESEMWFSIWEAPADVQAEYSAWIDGLYEQNPYGEEE